MSFEKEIMSQEKNRVDLSEISNKFTKQVLTDILCKVHNGKEILLTDWNFGEGFAKGDSYLSTVNKGKVYGITKDNLKQHVQVNFVVKSIPKNVGRKKTFRSAEFFCNEILFYTQASILCYAIMHICQRKLISYILNKQYVYICLNIYIYIYIYITIYFILNARLFQSLKNF